MDIWVLNTSLQIIDQLDVFESIIWKDKYIGFGDFELQVKASAKMLNTLKPDYYLQLGSSNRLMVIETQKITYDLEDGDNLFITGRSLESILDRRIIWQQTILDGNLQNGIKKLLDENCIIPSITDRKISNVVFEASTDPRITALTIKTQYTMTNLYTSILEICESNNLGFSLTLSESEYKFIFKLFYGQNRSYEQLINPYIVFSPSYENLLESSYLYSKREYKNVTLVAGEGEGAARKTTVVGSGSGLNRREMHTDAREISQTVNGVAIPDAQYISQLAQKGVVKLAENVIVPIYDGKIDTHMFEYEKDYFLGDIVQMVSEYEVEVKVRIDEIIYSESSTGVDLYPTFTIIE